MARKLNWGGIALSVVTGTSLAAVSVMGYVRYQHPEEFAQGSVKQARPEAWDEKDTTWGAYGSGLSNLLPAITSFSFFDDIPERVEAHRRRRNKEIEEAIHQTPR